MTTNTHTAASTRAAVNRTVTTAHATGTGALGAGAAVPAGTGRIDFAKTAPKAFRALVGFDAAAREGLDPALVELILIRASHLNRCAYCLHLHTNDARTAGESEDRLHLVAVWHEARHFFTPREQAALALTDAVTRLTDAGVPDDVYAEAAAQFDATELGHVLALVLAINTWNRLALATAKVAGTDERR
ncbi:carboxymuconolactone decarboxylase family protein [Streptomyces sp. NPDC048566]|uniref:carboxymuconolactone decarboxylase family protein n=1 Tax=Streptomyces sp. NPDC048566 TaxID=3365569 RepID=UPI003721414E